MLRGLLGHHPREDRGAAELAGEPDREDVARRMRVDKPAHCGCRRKHNRVPGRPGLRGALDGGRQVPGLLRAADGRRSREEVEALRPLLFYPLINLEHGLWSIK